MALNKSRSTRSVLLRCASAMIATGFLTTAYAQSSDEAIKFDLPAQSLEQALKSFSVSADKQLMFATDLAEGKTVAGLSGEMEPMQALDVLLDGTGLVYETTSSNVILVKGADTDQGGASDSKNLTPQPVLMAQNQTSRSQTTRTETSSRIDEDNEHSERDTVMDEIVVTGSNIRGIAPESSPLRVFDRDDILNSGAATAQDFLRLSPVNFGGGSNEGQPAGLPNDANARFNGFIQGALGSSVNLRGLGSGATLVLLNGNRLAPSSGIGNFVDISMIPASAIERVEVLTDGASSIYGGDAVAGVVNFVLRDDFDGAEASIRYGTVTEGDRDEYRVSLSGGKNWDTGNAVVVYEYFDQDNLSAADRSFSEEAPLPTDLLPAQERHSILGSISQEITTKIETNAGFFFSERESVVETVSASDTSFRSTPISKALGVSLGGSWKVSDTWFLDLSGVYSDVDSDTSVSTPTSGLVFQREVDSDIWTVDAKASGSLFKLPGGDVKVALGGHYREESLLNLDVLDDVIDRQADRSVSAVFAEAFIPIVGPDNAVPGIERLAINVSGRYEDYSDFGSTSDPKVGILWSPVDSVNLRGTYSTSFKPPPLGQAGANDFRVIAFPTAFVNSVLGLTPGDPSIADVVLLSASGVAKELEPETSEAVTLGFDFSKQWGRHHLTLKTTWFDIEFEGRLDRTPVPDNRTPLDAHNIAFNSPELFPAGTITFFPSQAEIDGLLDSADIVQSVQGAVPSDAEIISLVAVIRNLGRTLTSGIDFEVAYSVDTNEGSTFGLGLDAIYVLEFSQQAASTTPLVERTNTLYNPIDLKLRGRGSFTRNDFTANIFVNHTDDYRVDSLPDAARIDSWTTVDLNLSYNTENRPKQSLFQNTALRFSVLNLFDEDPPLTPDNSDFIIRGYDPTNASPIGRFVAFELTKEF